MASTLSLFSSPYGPIHQQHPSEQGRAARTLFTFLRRNAKPKSMATEESVWSEPLQCLNPGGRNKIECQIMRSTETTFSPLHEGEGTWSSTPPPPYTPYSGVTGPLAEDLVVLEPLDGAAVTPASTANCKVETKTERKERQRREKLERKQAQLVADDQRTTAELTKLGLL